MRVWRVVICMQLADGIGKALFCSEKAALVLDCGSNYDIDNLHEDILVHLREYPEAVVSRGRGGGGWGGSVQIRVRMGTPPTATPVSYTVVCGLLVFGACAGGVARNR